MSGEGIAQKARWKQSHPSQVSYLSFSSQAPSTLHKPPSLLVIYEAGGVFNEAFPAATKVFNITGKEEDQDNVPPIILSYLLREDAMRYGNTRTRVERPANSGSPAMTGNERRQTRMNCMFLPGWWICEYVFPWHQPGIIIIKSHMLFHLETVPIFLRFTYYSRLHKMFIKSFWNFNALRKHIGFKKTLFIWRALWIF